MARRRIRAAWWRGTAFAIALALPGPATFAWAPQSANAPLALSPPFALSVEQLFAWEATGPLADAANVSRVPLAGRMVDPGPGPDPAARLDPKVRVLFAPDGMNNFGNYLAPQPRFNLYTFTHWAQIDVLSWFAGTAGHNVMIPARPWVDTAHRNGVKVIGTAFFAPLAWGGSAKTLEAFLREEGEGRFPAADRLVEIARHYGFDGWLINQETDVSPELARRMARFVAYLTRIAPQGMEIHWYDAMLPDGRVQWQNAYNARNAPLLQDGATRVSDAMFLNYEWTPAGLRAGAVLAEARGRDRYALFIGADLWPARRNAQQAFGNRSWLRGLREHGDGPALGSVALFAPNFNFNAGGEFGDFRANPRDAEAFYDGEARLFAGDDRNMAAGNSTDAMRTGAWEGIAALVPARSTIAKLPFETGFNTGHGLVDARDGRAVGGPWHDMARQDPLPSWQFAYSPAAPLRIGYDFQRAWQGGSSLRVAPRDALRSPAEVPLFLADLPIDARTGLSVVVIAASPGYALRLTMADGSESLHPLTAKGVWHERHWCLGRFAGKVVRRISLVIDRGHPKFLNLGKIAIRSSCSPAT